MKEKKLLDRLEAFLDLGAKKRKKKSDELKKVLKKIRKKEKELIAEHSKAGKGKKSEALEKHIMILHAQRKKGIKALKKNKK
jgi:hypothetical protein